MQPPTNPFADQPAPINPYAAPVTAQPYQIQPHPGYQGGVWRQGKILVLHQRAQLPPICVKSGQPATTWLKRDLSWHHPIAYIGLLLGLIPFVILALILTKRATVHIGLCDEWSAKRKQRLMIAWIVGLSGVALFIAGIIFAANEVPLGIIGVPLGIVTGLGGLVFGSSAGSMVTPKKIDNELVWLKGVHPDVLAMFPELPPR